MLIFVLVGGKHVNSAGLFSVFSDISYFFVSEVTRGYVRICFFLWILWSFFFGWVGRYWWVNFCWGNPEFFETWSGRKDDWTGHSWILFFEARIPINLQWVHDSDMLLFVLGNQGISFSNKKSNKYPRKIWHGYPKWWFAKCISFEMMGVIFLYLAAKISARYSTTFWNEAKGYWARNLSVTR